MGSIPQSPGARTVSTHRDWDTGFPEPFCRHGNTSLPHPEARIGPDACITADDIPVSRTRERRSFLGNKYSKRTISHGRLTPQQQLQQQQQQTARHQPGPSTMYSDSAILDSDADSPTLSAEPFMPSRSADAHYGGQFGRPSKDSYDDRRSSSSAHGPPKDVSTMMVPPGSPSSTSTTRSRGFLQRLRWHRD